MNIDDHSLASRLPKTTDRPTLFGSPAEFSPLVRSADAPRKLEDWLYSDLPQLPIHVVSFNDATLLTVTFLHTLMDAMGLARLFQAWTAVLRGQEDQVPPFLGFDKDPLASLGEGTSPKQYVLSNKVLKGLRMLIFVLRFIFELVWYRDEERVVFIPGQFLQQMRDSALKELAAESSGESTPFVSEGDVLFSWWSRIMLSALKPAADRMIVLMNVFDIRPTLAEDHVPPNSAFVSNAVFTAVTFLSARQILEKPVSFVASRLRAALEQQRTKEQVQALAALQKAAVAKTGNLALFGDPGLLLITCSNWSKGRFFEIDFSSAVIAPGVPLSQRTNKLGRASYINSAVHRNGMPTRYCGAVFGKDAAGNFWSAWTMRTETWPKIEEQLKALSGN
ncbi:hypothetical protein VTN77DRAFT_6181 [Rasamsonia byssochlamydoides]|uniref:uncharacterized protein n=1 Tax=Rasamsonia byssochlamydoides TaxID=89139 RepID=UPI003742A6D1